MIKITLPNDEYETFKDDILQGAARGYTITYSGDIFTQEIDRLFFDLDDAAAVVAAGGDVEGYPLILELTAAKYATNVTEGIPNRSYTGEEGATVIRKWSEWKGANGEHYEIDGKYYIPLNQYGEYLKASEFGLLAAKTGYALKTLGEYNALKLEVAP